MKNNFPKNISNYKLIVSDFDGTLAGAEHVVTDTVVDAVKKWINNGKYFTIATGRQFNMIIEDCRKMNLTTPVIVRGGAEIIDPVTGETIAEELIDKQTIKELFSIFSQNKTSFLVEKGNILFANFYYQLDFPGVTKKELSDFTLQAAPKMAVKAYDYDVEKITELMDEIEVIHPNISIHRTHNSFGYGWDITSTKATKLHGIVKVLKYLGLTREQTVGVGDSYNDFPLLEAAGLKVAMGNAHPELKAIADIEVPSHEEDGVAYLIDKLLK
jgi:Cof subfamily protein (haloacid dehalogenase superfamily)